MPLPTIVVTTTTTTTIMSTSTSTAAPITTTAPNSTDTTTAATTTVAVALSSGDTAWILVSSALVFLMIPGVGFFYGGIVARKNFLSVLASSAFAITIVSIQWWLFGYSLSFSATGSSFIGNFRHGLLLNTGNEAHPLAPTISSSVFLIYQNMFAAITANLAFGSIAERGTIKVYLTFLFFWTTLVYDFVAYWSWAPNGWLHKMGYLDFAGGTPVHIVSGFASLAYALATGPRRTVDLRTTKPTSVVDVFIGTALLWFGWFGFNGGSELASNGRAGNALVVTNLAACFGGLTWMLIDMVRRRNRKLSLNAFCVGAVCGLVAITPASGFVQPYIAFVFGVIPAFISYFACEIKKLTKYRLDDACDVFAVHGIGGVIGGLLTGIFATNTVVTMSGDSSVDGGWLDHHLCGCVVGGLWSFFFTYLIVQAVGCFPCLKLKLNPKEEEIGDDWIELGEAAYGHDIIQYSDSYLADVQKTSYKESGLEIFKAYFKKSRTDEDYHATNINSIFTPEKNRDKF